MFLYQYHPQLPDFLLNQDALHFVQINFQVTPIDATSFNQNSIKVPANFDNMRPKKRCEYLAGRICARQALKQLQSSELDVEVNIDRSPCWPEGFIGSITHTTTLAAACISRTSTHSHVGVDIETIISFDVMQNIYSTVLTADEQIKFNQHNKLTFTREQYLTLIFSAKESLFKALYPDVGYLFDFNAASVIEVNQQHIVFILQYDLTNKWQKGTMLKVNYCLVDRHFYTLLTLPQ